MNTDKFCAICSKKLKKYSKNWMCKACWTSVFPFSTLDDNSYYSYNEGFPDENNIHNIDVTLNPTDKKTIEQINKLILEHDNPENEDTNFCKYYSSKKFLKSKFCCTQNLTIFHLNIASLQFHFDDLLILLKSLKHDFDIIAISETKIQRGIPPAKNINIPNYKVYETSTEATKGGTLIYISNKWLPKPRKDLEICEAKKIESTFVELVLPKSKNIIIGCIYKHHNIGVAEFQELLVSLFKKVEKENKSLYLCGDFNVDLLKIDTDKQTNDYFDSLTDNNVLPLITLPTRITNKSKTLIDNILTNKFNIGTLSGNLTVSISDHIPQFAIIPVENKISLPKNHNIMVQDTRKLNYNELRNDLLSLNFQYIKNNNQHNIHDITTKFLNDVNAVINKHAPLRKITKKEYKDKCKPWLTNSIKNLVRFRDKLFKNMKNETVQEKKNELKSEIKIYKSRIKHMIRASKKAYYDNFFQKNSTNTRNLWKGINNIISCKPLKAPINCIEVKINKTIKCVTDKKEITEKFNNFFSDTAENILKNQKFRGNKHYTHYMQKFNQSFKINLTTKDEVETIINNFNTSKSVGPNSVLPGILNKVSGILSEPISKICNISFQTGIFPDPLKLSKIIPIHKKGSKLEVENYRPISLLSNINKILEKLMHFRLQVYLEKHEMIYKLQFGFREKHSTNHAILSIIEKIQNAMENDQLAIGIFIDLQKAFDTVNHEILLDKLKYYGVKGTSNDWFKSYLSNRKQFTCVDGVNSTVRNVLHGVPQGSVLGPLLFLLYVNDLNQCIKNSSVFHFADDTNLMYVPERKLRNKNLVRRLNTDLKSLNNWLLSNKISLNTNKTELIFFRKKNTPLPKHKVILNGFKLTPSSSIRYVGLVIDEHLTYKNHMQSLNVKLKRANNILSIVRHYVPKSFLTQIYYGQFNSHLTYGCQAWGNNKHAMSQALVLQKKAVRIMNFCGPQTHASPLFRALNILKVPDLIKLNNVMFVHDTINEKSPAHFNDYFAMVKPQSRYSTTRNPKSLCSIPLGSIELSHYSNRCFVKQKCAIDWNETVKSLSDANSQTNWLKNLPRTTMKRLLRDHFIDTY